MERKGNTITLRATDSGEERAFTIEAAERLLSWRSNWELADDKFTYSKEHGIEYRTNQGIDEETH